MITISTWGIAAGSGRRLIGGDRLCALDSEVAADCREMFANRVEAIQRLAESVSAVEEGHRPVGARRGHEEVAGLFELRDGFGELRMKILEIPRRLEHGKITGEATQRAAGHTYQLRLALPDIAKLEVF